MSLLAAAETRAALEVFIAEKALAHRVSLQRHELLSGGTIQENWRVDLQVEGGPHAGLLSTVLRCDAPSAVSASHGRAQEYAVLKAVHEAGVTVPEPLWLCEDAARLGRPFFVMRRLQGTAASHLITKDGTYGGDRQVLLRRIGAEMAALHAIRPPRADLAFLPTYDEAPALHLVHKARAWLDRQPQPQPVLEWGLRWLERHAPPRDPGMPLALCHGDFRTGNYMVDEQGFTGLLDWEFTHWGDPLEDLGWFCAKCWRFRRPDLEAGGVGSREDLYAGYEARSGKPLDRAQVRYWEVMAHLNWAVIALQQADRHMRGEERSLLLALTGHMVPALEWEILNMTEHG
ncbi:MAG: phosphotransferase family protein [Burkholderiales bacterium]